MSLPSKETEDWLAKDRIVSLWQTLDQREFFGKISGYANKSVKYMALLQRQSQYTEYFKRRGGGDGGEAVSGGGGETVSGVQAQAPPAGRGGVGRGGGGFGGGQDLSEASIKPKHKVPKEVVVIGMEREKEEIRNSFIQPLLYPNLMTGSKGLLMYGPPGSGKSFFVSDIYWQLVYSLYDEEELKNFEENVHVYFFSANSADIINAYQGTTGKNVTKLFQVAENMAVAAFERGDDRATSIIFVDELESVTASRASGRGNAEAVTTFLQKMEGIDSTSRVIVIGATNLPEQIDTAMLSRFSTQLFVDLPRDMTRYDMLISALTAQVMKSPKLRNLGSPERKQEEKKIGDELKAEFNKEEVKVGLIRSLTKVTKRRFRDRFIDATGYRNSGEAEIREIGSNDESRTQTLFQDEEGDVDRRGSADARAEFGFSSRDLKNLFESTLQIVGKHVLQKKYDKKNCYPICPTEDPNCSLCKLSYAERATFATTTEILKSSATQDILMSQIQKRGATVNEDEYKKGIYYYIYGREEEI